MKGRDSLKNAREKQSDSARVEVVNKLATKGHLTARERINRLLDSDGRVEYGSIAAKTPDGEWISETGGVDFIGSIAGQTVIASSTDYTDHGGGYGAGRLGRLYQLALTNRWPVILFVDGGGSRARHPRTGLGHIETSGTFGKFNALDGVMELSGWVPTIAIVSGPSFAGHASIAGFSDFLISTPGSSIGMGGPPMVEAALGQRLTPNQLAGSEMHEKTGGIDLLVPNEEAAIYEAKRYLSYYIHKNNSNEPQVLNVEEGASIRSIIDGIIDADSLFQLRENFAPSVITALARIGGRSIGLLANDPEIDQGAIDSRGASKIARFIELCNCYEYPIVSLVNSVGCSNLWIDKNQNVTSEVGISRWHARPIMAHQRRTVPLLAVQIGKSFGLTESVMIGSSNENIPAIKLAWPNIEVGRHDGFSAVIDHDASDDVIQPEETRNYLLSLLSHFPLPPPRVKKKHRIDSW